MRADREQVARLLKTARGQIDGILRMAAESILGRANREVLRAHLEGCVREAVDSGSADEKIGEIAALLDKLVR